MVHRGNRECGNPNIILNFPLSLYFWTFTKLYVVENFRHTCLITNCNHWIPKLDYSSYMLGAKIHIIICATCHLVWASICYWNYLLKVKRPLMSQYLKSKLPWNGMETFYDAPSTCGTLQNPTITSTELRIWDVSKWMENKKTRPKIGLN